MNPTTEYWEERLVQAEFDHEVEVEKLKARIIALEDVIEQIAATNCTGPDERHVCYISDVPKAQWCPKCVAEQALTKVTK